MSTRRMRKALKRHKNIIGFLFSVTYIQILNYSLPSELLTNYCYQWLLAHVMVVMFTYVVHKLHSPIIYGTHQHLIIYLSTSYPLYTFIILPSFAIDTKQINYVLLCILLLLYLHLCTVINIIAIPFQSQPSPNKFRFSQPMSSQWYRCLLRWPGEIHYTSSLVSITYMPCILFHHLCLDYFSLQTVSFAVGTSYIATFVYCAYTLHFSLSDDIKDWTHITIHMTDNAQSTSKILHCNDIYSHKHDSHASEGTTVFQITDTHIDSHWSALQLQRLCERVVKYDPDLVLLTGDFYYTHNSDICADLLYFALIPLRSISHKCYACLGNHDLKRNKITKCVEDIFCKLNIKLLRNEITFHGPTNGKYIQMIGFDYVFKYQRHLRRSFMQNVIKHKSNDRTIALLHDPFALSELKGDENMCVFSGHTHGGHLGLFMLGITRFSVFRMLLGIPDMGLFVKGNNKLYVHRGNTMWAKSILRVGVPCEYSCVKIVWD